MISKSKRRVEGGLTGWAVDGVFCTTSSLGLFLIHMRGGTEGEQGTPEGLERVLLSIRFILLKDHVDVP